MLKDNNVMSRIQQDRPALVTLIEKNRHAPCNTCGSGSKAHLNQMDDYLRDVETLTGFHQVTGYGKALNLLKSNATTGKTEPEAFIIRVIRQELATFTPGTVVELEGNRTNYNGTEPDVVLVGGVLCEFKSWSVLEADENEEEDGTVPASYDASKSQFWNFERGFNPSFTQFTRYLAQISSLNGLRYYFDGRKPGGDENYVKGVCQTLFQTTSQSGFPIIYQINPAIFNIGGITSAADFLNVVNSNNLNHPIYGFIQVK